MKIENGKGKFVIRDDFPFANWKGTQAFDATSNVAQDGQVIDYFVIADAPCKVGADGGDLSKDVQRVFSQYSPTTWEAFRTTKLGKPHTICSSKPAATKDLTVKTKHAKKAQTDAEATANPNQKWGNTGVTLDWAQPSK
jgi:hypothetical protein